MTTPSPTNDNTQHKINRAHNNPERLNSIVRIIPPPTFLFSTISISSVLGLVLWSVFGSLPRSLYVSGVFIPPDSLSPVISTSDGYIYYISNLRPDVKYKALSFHKYLSSRFSNASNPSYIYTRDSTANQQTSNKLIGFISFYTTTTRNVLGSPLNILNPNIYAQMTSFNSKESSQTKEANYIQSVPFKSGKPFAIVFDPLSSVALEQASFQYLTSKFSLEQQLQFDLSLKKSTDALYSRQLEQQSSLINLEKLGIIPKTKVLSGQQALLQSETNRVKQDISLIDSRNKVGLNRVALQTGVSNTVQDIYFTLPFDGNILTKVVKSGSRVKKGEVIGYASLSETNDLISIISTFVDPSASQGLKPGMKVLVSPANVDAQKYGSIKGTLKSISTVSISSVSAAKVLGIKEIAEATYSKKGTMFLSTIELDRGNTPSGYLWNTSKGPEYKIPLSTPAKVRIIAENIRPISLLLPKLRSITGIN